MVHACLVNHFKGDPEVTQHLAHFSLSLLLATFAQVVSVKVENIVVLDPRVGRLS